MKVTDFGAVPRMEMRTVKTSLTTLVVVPSAVMVAVVCIDESAVIHTKTTMMAF